ncbi:MAG: hypothetical protein JOZ92_04195, partial [Candidatus Dormibacteraeota bacterium]|nr:hypothetical protein [Candidatus Dormibacteraeota bacterium]
FNPWVYFSDVLNDNCASHVLPFTSFQSDLSGPNPPDFVWVGPNINDNMHSGTIAQGDQWLQSNVGPILSSSWFTGAPSTLIITMDEHDAVDGEGAQPRGQRARADVTDGSCCDGADGGHVVEVVVSPKAYGSHTFTTAGDHYGTLRAIEEAYGLPLLGGARNTINGDLPLMGAPGPDSWTGPLPLNGQTNAAADAPVAGNWGTQQVLFYDTTGQHLAEMWRNTAGGAWSGPVDFSAGWNNPNANIVSQPSLSVTSGAIILYWQGANGHLWTLSYSYSKGWQGPFDVSAAWTNPNAMLASAPSAVITSRQELVYYTGNNGDVWETWYTFGSGWAGPADLTGGRSGCTQAASAPVAAQYSSQQVVFFQGPGNALCETWYPRSTGWGDPAYITQPDSAASGLDGAPVISVRFGALLLFWRGQDNHLWEAWYSSQWSGPVDISGSLPVFEQGTSLPPGSEDVYSAPSVMLTPNNAEVVTWTDASGNICQAWYGTGWSEIYSPSQQMGAGSPASAVTTAISPYGDRDVFWQDATQRLNIGSYLAGNAYTAGP